MTTGRINQVAFLRRRRRPHEPLAARGPRGQDGRDRRPCPGTNAQLGLAEAEAPAPAHDVPHPRERATAPCAKAANARGRGVPGNTEPAWCPPRAHRGRRAERGQANDQIPFRRYATQDTDSTRKASTALAEGMKETGGRQFDARARSLPTHAVKIPLTRPLRSLGNDPTKRTTTRRRQPSNVRSIEKGRTSTAGREEQINRWKGQCYSEGQPASTARASHHARVRFPQRLH